MVATKTSPWWQGFYDISSGAEPRVAAKGTRQVLDRIPNGGYKNLSMVARFL
jgi:hypothetical protein